MRPPVTPGNSSGVVSGLQAKVRAGDATELVDYLNIEYQIDPRNIYFSDGRTCLTEASSSDSNLQVVACLIRRFHCDVDQLDKTEWGQSALHRACKYSQKGIARFLLTEGASPNVRATGLITPLHWVASRGDQELAELLVERGADINAGDAKGATPLRWAIAHSQRSFGEFLVRLGAVAYNHPPLAVSLNRYGRPSTEDDEEAKEGNGNEVEKVVNMQRHRADSWAHIAAQSPMTTTPHGLGWGGSWGHDVDTSSHSNSNSNDEVEKEM